MLTPEESHIVKALKASRAEAEQAFKQLVDLYKEPLYWHVRHMVKDHDDAHDVLQNTFVKVYRYIHNFKGDSKLYSWMYRIATNEAITFLNKKAKRLNISSQELQEALIENLKADIHFDGDEIQLKLQKAVNSLPQKQQQVFIMHYFEGLKYKEIAEILEVSEGALKSNYHHAVQKIKEFLARNQTFNTH